MSKNATECRMDTLNHALILGESAIGVAAFSACCSLTAPERYTSVDDYRTDVMKSRATEKPLDSEKCGKQGIAE